LANTGIIIGADWAQHLATANSTGILTGLILGKPLGITLLSFAAIALGISRLPSDKNWRHLLGAGILRGIGFTMSIFITNLAFPGDMETVNASKMAILLASLVAGTLGFLWLKLFGKPVATDDDA
jgi:NhaA family Na+:H+ antiporter